jgi:hypothetical protein
MPLKMPSMIASRSSAQDTASRASTLSKGGESVIGSR